MSENPGFWMNETSGVLRPAVEAYLHGKEMTPEQIGAMRAYLRQWILADGWAEDGPLLELRASVEGLDSPEAIQQWLDDAEEAGIDPL